MLLYAVQPVRTRALRAHASMPPSSTATHVIDAVARRIAAAVAVAGGGAALATVLVRLLLWQPLNITQALCVGLAVAASLVASMLLAGPVAFASREPARRAALHHFRNSFLQSS